MNKKCLTFDVSFWSYSQSFGQRRPCFKCNGQQGNNDCPDCEGTGQAYLNYKGIRTGGLYGVFQFLMSYLKEGYEIIVPFDPPKQNLTRTKLLDTYKGNRAPVPDWIKYQQKLLEEILPCLPNIQCYVSETSESDDVLAAISVKKAKDGYYVILASDDKDMAPVLAYDNIDIFRQKALFKKKDFKPWLKKKYNVEFNDPARFSEFLAIAGDNADNYKGIDGLGPKAAEYFINRYSRVDELWDDWNNIEEKYKKKLVKNCIGDTCKKCKALKCDNFADIQVPQKETYKLKDELALQMRIADLELDAEYKQIKGDKTKEEVISILEKHGLRNVLQNIDLFYK